MGAEYTRQSSTEIQDGNTIQANDFNAEFQQLQSAFNATTGHTHDGTLGEGGPITKIGPAQNITVSGVAVTPSSDDTISIGGAGAEFKDLHIDGLAYIDGLGEDMLVATTAAVQFRDTDLSINSSADGQLDIDADTELEITAPTVDINASTSVNISNDLKLDSDSAVLSFGSDDDVTLTHVADTALLVNDGIAVQFRDSGLSINSSTDGQLDIDADTELELTSPIVDINASTSVNISNDLKLDSDSAVLSFGADGEVSIIHGADTGIQLKTTGVTADAVNDSLNIRVETDGSAAAGIGVGITFTAETGATNFETIGAIESTATDVTSGQEDADLTFYTMQGGTLTEVLRYDGIDDELVVSGGISFGSGTLETDSVSSKTANTNLSLSANGTGVVYVDDSLTVTGDLTVSGTTTTVNTEEINLADNTIVFNSNATGSATEDAGIEIERGDDANKTLLWNETDDKWTVGTETFVAGAVEVDNVKIDGNTISSTDTDGNIDIDLNGSGKLTINGSTSGVTDILDEDDMTSDSDTALATQQSIKAYVDTYGVPAGAILMWSGSVETIPDGWYLCDGTNSTPDLRNRFIVGAGDTYAVDDTGGSADAIVVEHNHTITDSGHNHNNAKAANGFSLNNSDQNYDVWSNWGYNNTEISTSTETTGITIDNAGSSGTNANLPPYYALAYIMKAIPA